MTILVRLPAGRAEDPDHGPGSERGPEPPRLRAPFCVREAPRRTDRTRNNYHDNFTIVLRRYLRRSGASLVAALVAGCGNETARAPNPTAYDWPESMAYRVREVVQAMRDSLVAVRRESSRTLRFVLGYDGAYSVWQDSVRLTAVERGGAPTAERPMPEDTLRYFVRLSRRGEFLSEEPACDPAVSECGDAPRSVLLLRLRNIIPGLPVWWPPKGHPWEDTLRVDDSDRSRGQRGMRVIAYRSDRDTAAGGSGYWIVSWRSAWSSSMGSPALGDGLGAGGDSGVVYVDKRRLIPALAVWASAWPPRGPGEGGATRTEVSGRAVLVGSVFDAAPFTQEAK